jgi:hypothetical protein
MPTAHVRLKPIQWFQQIGHYPKQGGEVRYLRATCTYDDDSNVRLSTGARLSAFVADLSIMDECLGALIAQLTPWSLMAAALSGHLQGVARHRARTGQSSAPLRRGSIGITRPHDLKFVRRTVSGFAQRADTARSQKADGVGPPVRDAH